MHTRTPPRSFCGASGEAIFHSTPPPTPAREAKWCPGSLAGTVSEGLSWEPRRLQGVSEPCSEALRFPISQSQQNGVSLPSASPSLLAVEPIRCPWQRHNGRWLPSFSGKLLVGCRVAPLHCIMGGEAAGPAPTFAGTVSGAQRETRRAPPGSCTRSSRVASR